jgi:chromosome segregation ATPase
MSEEINKLRLIISERETLIRDLQNRPDLSGEVRRLNEELARLRDENGKL